MFACVCVNECACSLVCFVCRRTHAYVRVFVCVCVRPCVFCMSVCVRARMRAYVHDHKEPANGLYCSASCSSLLVAG